MWISVEDRLPKDRAKVDAWRRGHGRIPDCTCFHVKDGRRMATWYLSSSNDSYTASITHWMPIPIPPEEFRDGKNRGPE